jgi:phosphoglycolate phosphatase-like HAD superfamily hydrolase
MKAGLCVGQPHLNMELAQYGVDETPYCAQYVVYVGDRPEDEAAAKNAGVPFQWAAEFFGGI